MQIKFLPCSSPFSHNAFQVRMDVRKDDNENAYKPINATFFFKKFQVFSKHALVFKFSVDVTKNNNKNHDPKTRIT
jgi:hypothetical protein